MSPPASSYRPIADYAIIGDSRSAALISREGSIDWLCWPRFDSRSVFARILDAQRGGAFSLATAIDFSATRRYLDATNVLETTYETAHGSVRVLDLMPALTEEQKRGRLLPFRQLLRRVEGISGEVPMLAVYEPRPDYARVSPRLELRRSDTVWCASGPEVWHLRSNTKFEIDGASATSAFPMVRGRRCYFALSYETHAPAVFANIDRSADDDIDRTIGFWQRWSSSLTYDGPHRAHVLRSALTLKLLAYAPSGGIVAAPESPRRPASARCAASTDPASAGWPGGYAARFFQASARARMNSAT